MNQVNSGGNPGSPSETPQGSVVPMGDEWAAGVGPVVVSPRSRRLRWGIAGAVVLAVTLVTAGGVFVLSGAAGAKSLTAGVAPKDAVAFLEIRTDLPGDQHAMLADFLSHFPGFQDRAQFDYALDNLLNRLTGEVSADLQYTSAFKPWMEGEVSIAAMDGSLSSLTAPSAVAIFALKDRAAAQTWIAGELTRIGVKTASQDYAGTTLYAMGAGLKEGAYAFTDQDLLLGTVTGVKAALDTKTHGSLADNVNYQAAMKSVSGDSLARFYLDPRTALTDMMGSGLSSMGMLNGMMGSSAAPLDLSSADLPAWVAGSIQAESGQMVMNLVMPRSGSTGPGNHTSRLASILPGTTVAVFEVHGIGKIVTDQLAALASRLPTGSVADSLKTIKDGLALVGGLDWLGDGVAAITKNGSVYGGGVVVEAADASTASSKVALVTTYAALAGGTLHISSRTETYKGISITVFSVPDGAGNSMEIALAAKDSVIVAGYTDAFVKAVIDTTPATSLNSQPDYSAVMAAAGASNDQSMYVDIPALEDEIGIAALSSSRWTTDYKPYFDHFGGIGYSVIDGNTVILRLVVTAR
ncbi:MAG: DUF3352 domain-containing protein [Candidatus Limnocylindrales bacterium]